MIYSHEFYSDALALLKGNIMCEINETIEDLKADRRLSSRVNAENGRVMILPENADDIFWLGDSDSVTWVSADHVGIINTEGPDEYELELVEVLETDLIEILKYLQSIS